MNEYLRCIHIDETGAQCESWYPVLPGSLIKLCARHRSGELSPAERLMPDLASYVSIQNEHRARVIDMSLDDLDAHLSTLEAEMKAFQDDAHKKLSAMRSEIATKKGVHAEKISKLSKEEQDARRAMKVDLTPKKPRTDKSLRDEADLLFFKNRGLNDEAIRAALKMLKTGLDKENIIKMLNED